MSALAQPFDLTDGVTVLRLVCGLFFIPHTIAKFTEPATLNSFKVAGFNPPATWMYFAAAVEIVLATGLVFAIYTPYVAAIAAIHMLIAAVTIYKISRKWIWLVGGMEYCVFWMLCCVALALLTWPK